MKRLLPIVAYTAAGLTLAFAVTGPFLWFNLFVRVVAAAGLRIDPYYSGGEPARVIARGGYQVVVNRPVPRRSLFARSGAFVQLTWKPAAALPARVSDQIDLDGDHKPDLVVSFDVPRDAGAALRVDVDPLSALVQPMRRVGKQSFSSLIARVGDTIVVRVPLQYPK